MKENKNLKKSLIMAYRLKPFLIIEEYVIRVASAYQSGLNQR